jgi:hypothetical protein
MKKKFRKRYLLFPYILTSRISNDNSWLRSVIQIRETTHTLEDICMLTSLLHLIFWVRVVVFNATFNNILVMSWRLLLLREETRVPSEKHRPVASH